MKVSLNWIKQFTSVDLPVDELVEKIGAQLGAVEEVIDVGKKYEGLLVVKVVSCVKHPNADKLSLCMVDDGGAHKKVKRAADGLIQVVCGAPNVKAGMLAVWIPPGSAVPESFDKEPFVIEARPIRNKTSHGMLASAKELAIGDDHSGIVEIDKDAKPGDSFAELYRMNDYIIDIENKMFTHRPDLFGHIGIAREIAGIQGREFASPDWYREDAGLPADGRKNVLKLAVSNDVPELVPRFCAVAIKDVKVAPSPLWLRASLSRLGVNSISNIVDLTNFYMLVSGQPLHAYDYDKVKAGILGARKSKKGEKLALLNGKTIDLKEGTVVITDGRRPIGLAGIMGGADTEVDENTKNIILEAANFDMNQTRRAAMEYGLFTDAATRFTKNQSPRQNLAVLCKAVQDIQLLAGGRVASPVVDDKHFKSADSIVKVETTFINSRLGLNLTSSEIKKILENVEFKVQGSENLTVTAPFWRTDIEIPEDIVEEIGRLYGYDKLPVELPKRDLAPAAKDVPLDFKARLRDIMVQAGANEVLTYSFVHEDLLKSAGQDPKEAFRIINAVSPDLQYYRLSLTPSLLEKVHPNQRAGYDYFALFEIGKGHVKGLLDDDKLPAETETLAAVTVNPYAPGAAYYQARGLADYIFWRLNLTERTYLPLAASKTKRKTSWYKNYEPGRTAVVWSGERILGFIGEPTAKLRAALKLPPATAMFELDIQNLYEVSQPTAYRPLNRFPSSTQDICLKLPAAVDYQEADKFVWSALDKLAKRRGYNYEMETIDIFRKQNDAKHHQITWRINVSHPDKTLTTTEVSALLDDLAAKAKKELKAERI